MNQPPSAATNGHEGPTALQSTAPRRRSVLKKTCVAVLVLTIVIGLNLYRIYGTETQHASRGSIWWSERGRHLIPPAATDITLQQDLLDHYAIYTISEKDLNAFLNERFASDGEEIDSFSEREHPNANDIGKAIGRLGWGVTKDTVVYHYYTSNGASSSYYHDPTTGQTYQSSAYW